ncbi:hypothetical protein [Nonomuraea sediminis]|uniref:hypothetical protein n=1 Tax=Nonomuraea sediminis TaxID=2835864 RepID=UPI001BDCCE36|nr:hypothetical protein [Nonomuraea sediminis]
MIPTLRYEFVMQVRRPSMWIIYGLVVAFMVTKLAYWSLDLGESRPAVPRHAMVVAASIVMALLPIVYGCLLADRPQRARVLRVEPVLAATPSGATARLVGRYLGTCAATAVPIAVAYFGRALLYAVVKGEPAALGWAVVIFLAAVLPGLVFVGALVYAGTLLIPPMLFRVLFVAYWFWGNLIPPDLMPTLSHTIFSATGEYARDGLLAPLPPYGVTVPGAFDFLRPAATQATALLWIGLMIALAVAMLFLVRLHASRSES